MARLEVREPVDAGDAGDEVRPVVERAQRDLHLGRDVHHRDVPLPAGGDEIGDRLKRGQPLAGLLLPRLGEPLEPVPQRVALQASLLLGAGVLRHLAALRQHQLALGAGRQHVVAVLVAIALASPDTVRVRFGPLPCRVAPTVVIRLAGDMFATLRKVGKLQISQFGGRKELFHSTPPRLSWRRFASISRSISARFSSRSASSIAGR
ncbi:Uncharacterised protein [Starkeya nomas]|uniref:Uncharacterized protein n=1 Tax=Starkeya nomas TaxID=2666134 RepID=A0A5S9R3K0_9HYPH|nr:Uncharacterised protein [Starkeya nomas]